MRFDRRACVALLLLASASTTTEGFVVVAPRPSASHRRVGDAAAHSGSRAGGLSHRTPPLGATLQTVPKNESSPRPRRVSRRNRANAAGGRNAAHRRSVTADSTTKAVEREIVRLGRLGRTDDALALYQAVWDADENDTATDNSRHVKAARPTTRLMNSAIDACARARPPRPERAFGVWREGMDGGRTGARRLSPNVFTFGALMSACARSRDADKALELLRSMQDDYKVEPNAVVYSTAISACERSLPPKAEHALKLLREASEDPAVEMGVVGYNTAISALARAGEWRQAVRLLDEMEDGCEDAPCSLLTTNIGDNNDVYGPSSPECRDDDDDTDEDTAGEDSTGRRAAAAAASNNASLLDPDVTKPRPDEVTYGTVMAACERSEEWGMVLRYAKALRTKAEGDPAFAMDGVTLTTALHACQRLGRCDEALEYLDMMKDLGGAGSVVVDGNGDGEGGGEGTETDGGRGPNPAAAVDRTRTTNGRNRQGARAPLLGPDAVAYRLAISACARSNKGERWADGIHLLGEMADVTGSKPDVVAYTAAMGGCAEAGRHEVALQLLDRMLEEGVDPNVVTYNVAIRACGTASARAAAEYGGDSDAAGADPAVREPMERALALLETMKRGEAAGAGGDGDGEGVKPDVVTYNAAIRACAEGMSIKGALTLMDDLRSSPDLVPTVVTYGSLMTACERVGSVNCASKVFGMLKEQQQADDTLEANEIIYGAAISCCRKAGQRERTLLLLQKMIKDGLSPNTATCNTVLMSQAEGKTPDLDKAAAVYKLMGSDYVPRAKPNRQTYTILVRSFAGNLRPNDAEIFLRKMSSAGLAPDVDLYTATVTSYERSKQPMKALRLMESMREDGYNFYDIPVLDSALKKAISLVNVVGQGLSSSPSEEDGEGDGGDDEGEFDVDNLLRK